VQNRDPAANGDMGGNAEMQLPILPLVMSQGHDWKMMVAEAMFDSKAKEFKVAISRHLKIGSTNTKVAFISLGNSAHEAL